MSKLKIGITERGDAGCNLSWFNKLKNDPTISGAILVTKSCDNSMFIPALHDISQIKPIILHATITGWGGTKMEPNVHNPVKVMESIRNMIDSNQFPAKNIVLRVDPIIPTTEGLMHAIAVLEQSKQFIPDVTRIRMSIYDDYHAARDEMMRRGYPPVDNITKWKNEKERRPSQSTIDVVAQSIIAARPNTIFECCAEPELVQAYPDHFTATGCCSAKDLEIMNLPVPNVTSVNGQNRFGCLCITAKTELLTQKARCANNCAYCYWGK